MEKYNYYFFLLSFLLIIFLQISFPSIFNDNILTLYFFISFYFYIFIIFFLEGIQVDTFHSISIISSHIFISFYIYIPFSSIWLLSYKSNFSYTLLLYLFSLSKILTEIINISLKNQLITKKITVEYLLNTFLLYIFFSFIDYQINIFFILLLPLLKIIGNMFPVILKRSKKNYTKKNLFSEFILDYYSSFFFIFPLINLLTIFSGKLF